MEDQAAKMDDVWPIENVWGIIVEKLRFKKFKTMAGLKRAICKIWREIDVETCKRMMYSIPLRLNEVIKNEGRRISKVDTSGLDVLLS